MYKTIPENTLGNDYVVGDIHGMFPLLESLLLDLNFDKTLLDATSGNMGIAYAMIIGFVVLL